MVLLTTNLAKIGVVAAVFLVTPLVAGLLTGLANRMRVTKAADTETALLKPFYDFSQLLRQTPAVAGNASMIFVLLQLAFALLALAMIVLQRNLLAGLLLQACSSLIAMAVGMNQAASMEGVVAKNPLKSFLTYQPVLLAIAAGCGLAAGGFGVEALLGQTRPLVVELPLLWLSLLYVAYVSNRLDTEQVVAGPLLAVARLAGCFRQATLLLFAGIFWADSMIVAGLVAVLLGYGLAIADDLRARLHWRLALVWGWGFVFFACAINLSWVYIKYQL